MSFIGVLHYSLICLSVSQCLCVPYALPSTHGGQMWASDVLELELQTAVSHHVGAGVWTRISSKSVSALNLRPFSPASLSFGFSLQNLSPMSMVEECFHLAEPTVDRSVSEEGASYPLESRTTRSACFSQPLAWQAIRAFFVSWVKVLALDWRIVEWACPDFWGKTDFPRSCSWATADSEEEGSTLRRASLEFLSSSWFGVSEKRSCQIIWQRLAHACNSHFSSKVAYQDARERVLKVGRHHRLHAF